MGFTIKSPPSPLPLCYAIKEFSPAVGCHSPNVLYIFTLRSSESYSLNYCNFYDRLHGYNRFVLLRLVIGHCCL